MNRPESARVLQLRSRPPEWFGLGRSQSEVAIIRAASTMGISRHFDYVHNGVVLITSNGMRIDGRHCALLGERTRSLQLTHFCVGRD